MRVNVSGLVARFWERTHPVLPDSEVEWSTCLEEVFHEVPASHRADFLKMGYRSSDFFPHRIHWLPKCGPDGAKLAARMWGIRLPDQLWQGVVFGLPPVTAEFPAALFSDPDLLWHRQHFGRLGQVASVTLATDGSTLYTMALQSDLVQRISSTAGPQNQGRAGLSRLGPLAVERDRRFRSPLGVSGGEDSEIGIRHAAYRPKARSEAGLVRADI